MKKTLLLTIVLFTVHLHAQCWDKVSVGAAHTVAVKDDGTLWSWGANNNAQLGNGFFMDTNHPEQVGIDADWVMVSAGSWHSAAIKTNGTLWLWGDNSSTQLGMGEDSWPLEPAQLGTDTDWVFVDCGVAYTVAIKTDGTLWAWGDDVYGQLGVNQFSGHEPYPVQVGTDTNWKQVAAGDLFTMGVKTNGTLWAWGTSHSGQFGSGSTEEFEESYLPIQIGTDTDWNYAEASRNEAAAIKINGTLWMWGRNDYGQLGIGTTTDSNIPVQVGTDTWQDVLLSKNYQFQFSAGIKTNGSLWTWGYNEFYQLGNGTTTNYNVPTPVLAGTSFTACSAGESFSAAVKDNGQLAIWGAGNGSGYFGFGNTNVYTVPGTLGCNGLNVKDNILQNLYLYPNPVTNILTINNPNGITIDSIAVYDITGKIVLKQETSLNINVQQLPQGVYLLKINTQNGTSNYKFIKQ